jgi:hypothetical protein
VVGRGGEKGDCCGKGLEGMGTAVDQVLRRLWWGRRGNGDCGRGGEGENVQQGAETNDVFLRPIETSLARKYEIGRLWCIPRPPHIPMWYGVLHEVQMQKLVQSPPGLMYFM